MKNSFSLVIVLTWNLSAFAAVDTAKVHTAKGVMPNPVLAPLGQLVNVENGKSFTSIRSSLF